MLPATMKGVPFEKRERVRIGILGVGSRGLSLLHNLLMVDGASVVAVCDTSSDFVERASARIQKADLPAPATYNGEGSFEAVIQREDIDLVFIATPWDQHTPMAVMAMEHGKHVAVEVPAATTLEQCWQLVETSERTRQHCVILENCCYGENEMIVLNMVRAGLFGTITHGEAAYIHDLRDELMTTNNWRRSHHTREDGNLYPTHGLGPVARYMEINQGDRFTQLVSMSSREASLTEYRNKATVSTDAKRTEQYVCGDMNTSLIRTEWGRTIVLQHDVVTPRPYDRINMIAGSQGTFRDYPARLFLDGKTPAHQWETLDAYKEQYQHPLWQRLGEVAKAKGGHGGMDFLMCWRLIECMREGLPPDMDVYDAATWSAPGPLSALSVAQGSMPVEFPDFTRGNYK